MATHKIVTTCTTSTSPLHTQRLLSVLYCTLVSPFFPPLRHPPCQAPCRSQQSLSLARAHTLNLQGRRGLACHTTCLWSRQPSEAQLGAVHGSTTTNHTPPLLYYPGSNIPDASPARAQSQVLRQCPCVYRAEHARPVVRRWFCAFAPFARQVRPYLAPGWGTPWGRLWDTIKSCLVLSALHIQPCNKYVQYESTGGGPPMYPYLLPNCVLLVTY